MQELDEAHVYPDTCPMKGDTTKFRAHSDESVLAMLDRLKALKARLTKQQFKDRRQQAGWNLNETGLLLSGIDVKPVTGIMFDWMHVYVASGIFNLEAGLLLAALQSKGIGQGEFHRQLQAFNWPTKLASKAVSGQNVFAKKQEGDLKRSASECLSLYPVLRAYSPYSRTRKL